MEELNGYILIAFGIDSSEIWSLVLVAAEARQGKVACRRWTARFSRDDVVDLESQSV